VENKLGTACDRPIQAFSGKFNAIFWIIYVFQGFPGLIKKFQGFPRVFWLKNVQGFPGFLKGIRILIIFKLQKYIYF
jgi:hypothetical protein